MRADSNSPASLANAMETDVLSRSAWRNERPADSMVARTRLNYVCRCRSTSSCEYAREPIGPIARRCAVLRLLRGGGRRGEGERGGRRVGVRERDRCERGDSGSAFATGASSSSDVSCSSQNCTSAAATASVFSQECRLRLVRCRNIIFFASSTLWPEHFRAFSQALAEQVSFAGHSAA